MDRNELAKLVGLVNANMADGSLTEEQMVDLESFYPEHFTFMYNSMPEGKFELHFADMPTDARNLMESLTYNFYLYLHMALRDRLSIIPSLSDDHAKIKQSEFNISVTMLEQMAHKGQGFTVSRVIAKSLANELVHYFGDRSFLILHSMCLETHDHPVLKISYRFDMVD